MIICAHDILSLSTIFLQVCSAVQNQDFTLIYDYILGLKAAIYLKSVDELQDWNMQSPNKAGPIQKGKPVMRLNDKITFFGPSRDERSEKVKGIRKVLDRDLRVQEERIKYGLKRPIFQLKVSVWF